ncbi:PREDICTED: lipase maturation factor 2 [Nanorana parkeri]|uniref:lipase maturation factor 2 n=1 Tax=Nanorana parkeri TaxID=125878 RepID=UPI000854FBB2|nr:PREDICTED: lipase maturation factor 2 [Nanorana parkeri]
MGELRLVRGAFLWGMSGIYLCAFLSLYTQIPGLYGREGVLPAWRMLRFTGKGFWEQLKDSPTLLWLGPSVGLDTEQGMELICLLGVLLSVGALLFSFLRDSLVFLLLWIFYLSVYQVGQVFLYFQWDSLLLEAGFLTILVAPLRALRSKTNAWSTHDGITFLLIRWLLFRLMFASGIVKLTSRCPTWWGLTALTYHYETQCIPTPAAWFAHQLPVWLQKVSVVATYVIEIGVPWLFFLPSRRLRLFSFYSQALLQVLIIITGNYNFFNLLTLVLCISLLDDQHLKAEPKGKKAQQKGWGFSVQSLVVLLDLLAFGLLAYWSVKYFDLQINLENYTVESKTAFTHHDFLQWLRTLTFPSMYLAGASLGWEILRGMYRSASTRGIFWKFWATMQWILFSFAAVGMFAVSLVFYMFLTYESNGQLSPTIHQLFNKVDRFQLANSYGLFRRMTGVGGRPEVVVEGSYDKETWTEIEFMYKPGNVSAAPPVITPHQPRLDWQMWFAALGHHTQSPWFTSFVHQLLQGNQDVVRLVQNDESLYPFHARPPHYIRAQLFKYWFTETDQTGKTSSHWWRRRHAEEFFPTVYIGDPTLESLLTQHGLKDKPPPRRSSDAPLPSTLKLVRDFVRPYPAHLLLYSLLITIIVINSLQALFGGGSKAGASKQKSHSKPQSEKKKQKGSSGHDSSASGSVGDAGHNIKRREKS